MAKKKATKIADNEGYQNNFYKSVPVNSFVHIKIEKTENMHPKMGSSDQESARTCSPSSSLMHEEAEFCDFPIKKEVKLENRDSEPSSSSNNDSAGRENLFTLGMNISEGSEASAFCKAEIMDSPELEAEGKFSNHCTFASDKSELSAESLQGKFNELCKSLQGHHQASSGDQNMLAGDLDFDLSHYQYIEDCYGRVENPDKRKCFFCHIEITKKPFNLKRHLFRSHLVVYEQVMRRAAEEKGEAVPQASLIGSKGPASSVMKKTSVSSHKTRRQQEMADKAMTQWIASDLMALDTVESPAFRKLLRVLNPDYEPPSLDSLATTHLNFLFEEIKEKVKNHLLCVSSYNVTFDLWTCTRFENQCLVVTAHFIDSSWNLRSYCIGCFEYNEIRAGEELTTAIADNIRSLNLKMPSFVVSNSVPFVVKVCHQMKLQRLSCIAHSIKLCLDPILFPKCSKSPITEALEKARHIASLFKRSPKIWEEFKIIYRREKNVDDDPREIPVECRTRWNSCFPMIEEVINHAEQLREAASKLDIPSLNISEEEITILENIQLLLKPFQEASSTLCAYKFSTSSLVFPVVYAINLQLNSIIVKEELDSVKYHLQKEVNQQLLPYTRDVNCLIATYLDPRFKKKIFSESDKELIIKGMEAFIERELDNNPKKIRSDSPESRPPKRAKKNANSSSHPPTSSMFETLLESYDSDDEIDSSVNSFLHNELELYRKYYPIDKNIKSVEFNPLQYWKVNETIFPILSSVARVFLSIPATSMENETLFTDSGDAMGENRLRLNSNDVAKLVFINRNLQAMSFSKR